ncbi:5420_t:CDS:1, partial [Scutellospora calospora]
MLSGVADVVHVRRRSEGSVEGLVAGVGSPVCSRLTPAVWFAVDAAVSGGERVPELNGGVGIHWVRRVYAGYEGEAGGSELK